MLCLLRLPRGQVKMCTQRAKTHKTPKQSPHTITHSSKAQTQQKSTQSGQTQYSTQTNPRHRENLHKQTPDTGGTCTKKHQLDHSKGGAATGHPKGISQRASQCRLQLQRHTPRGPTMKFPTPGQHEVMNTEGKTTQNPNEQSPDTKY